MMRDFASSQINRIEVTKCIDMDSFIWKKKEEKGTQKSRPERDQIRDGDSSSMLTHSYKPNK